MEARQFAAAVNGGLVGLDEAVEWVEAHVWPYFEPWPTGTRYDDPGFWDRDREFAPDGSWSEVYIGDPVRRAALTEARRNARSAPVPRGLSAEDERRAVAALQTMVGHE